MQVEVGAGGHLAVRVGDLDLVGAGVGAARAGDGHRQREGVVLAGDRVDAELEPVARLERRVVAEPLRRRLRRRLDLAREDDALALLPQRRLLGELGRDAHRRRCLAPPDAESAAAEAVTPLPLSPMLLLLNVMLTRRR